MYSIPDFAMSSSENLDRLKQLMEQVAGKNIPLLQRCSEAKILAVQDFDSAIDKYLKIASEILTRSDEVDSRVDRELSEVKTALSSDVLNQSFIHALKGLKSSYYESVLKPAVSQYLRDVSKSASSIENIYERAVEFDKLLEVVEFFHKVNQS